MRKTHFFTLAAVAFLLTLVFASLASAYSVWEPKYESYKIGASSHSGGAYSSVSTYEKVVVENEDRYGSDKITTVKKSESETYIPASRKEVKYVYDYEYDAPRYRYLDSYGRGRYYDEEVRYGNVYIQYDDAYYPSTNWRFKESYKTFDYPNENEYGYGYYYEPRFDWHAGVYNWRY